VLCPYRRVDEEIAFKAVDAAEKANRNRGEMPSEFIGGAVRNLKPKVQKNVFSAFVFL
jgi:hypothetical protein